MPLLNLADALYVGSGAATAAYVGSTQVWTSESGTPAGGLPVLRGVDVGSSQNASGSTATVTTPSTTAAGDTLYAVRSLNYSALPGGLSQLPGGSGVSWSLVDTVVGGNIGLGLYRGVVTSGGSRSVSFTTGTDSSQFAFVRTYEGDVIMDAYNEVGQASATTLTIPGVTTTTEAQVFGAWTTVQFASGSEDGSALQLPAGMTGRVGIPGDPWIELMTAHVNDETAGSTGGFSSSLVIGGQTREADSGWAGMLVAVKNA